MKYMRNFIYLGIGLIIFFSSCQTKQKKNDKLQNNVVSKPVNLTSYVGNALIFFQENYTGYERGPYAKLILVDEKDSCVFKNRNFDVQEAIKGKCCITIFFGYDVIPLLKNKSKQEVKFRICNIPSDYNFYLKCWVNYAGYIESKKYPNRKLNPKDSCDQTCIIYPYMKSNKNRKIRKLVYKILSQSSCHH